ALAVSVPRCESLHVACATSEAGNRSGHPASAPRAGGPPPRSDRSALYCRHLVGGWAAADCAAGRQYPEYGGRSSLCCRRPPPGSASRDHWLPVVWLAWPVHVGGLCPHYLFMGRRRLWKSSGAV